MSVILCKSIETGFCPSEKEYCFKWLILIELPLKTRFIKLNS